MKLRRWTIEVEVFEEEWVGLRVKEIRKAFNYPPLRATLCGGVKVKVKTVRKGDSIEASSDR